MEPEEDEFSSWKDPRNIPDCILNRSMRPHSIPIIPKFPHGLIATDFNEETQNQKQFERDNREKYYCRRQVECI